MSIPFEKLMEAVAALPEADPQLTLGEIARRLGEPDIRRIADAIVAVRVASGERTYVEIRAEAQPAVRQALDEDRGTIISGTATPWTPGL